MTDKVALNLNNGVGRRHGHVDGRVGLQCLHHIIKDALTKQWTHGIVENKVNGFVFVGLNGRKARLVAFVSTFKDTLHLAPTVFKYDVFDVCNEHGIAYNGYLVNVRVTLEHIHRVLDNHLSSHFEELFGCGHAQSLSHSARQNDGDVTFCHIDAFVFLCMQR